MVKAKFVNKSGEEVILYQQNGSILGTLGAGKRWDKDPKEGTLSTVVVAGEQKFPAPRPRPRWIDEVEWVWEECPEDSIYAPYRSITFLDDNVVKLRQRPHWKPPEMEWPVVTFLFKSHRMKTHKERLDRDGFGSAAVFYNGIPCRLTVNALSKYAPYKKWIFSEVMELRDGNPPYKQMVETYEITQHGEDKRNVIELEKIAELKAEAEERQKLGLV